MNIIFPYDTTEIGGSYTSIAIFASELIKDKNYNITFYLPRKGLNTKLFLDTGADVKYYNINSLMEKACISPNNIIRKLIRRFTIGYVYIKSFFYIIYNKTDIIHVNDAISLQTWGAAGKKLGRKVIWQVRRETPGYNDNINIRYASFLLSDAFAIKKRFNNIKNTPQFHAIHNVVDSKIFYPSKTDKISNLPIRIGFIGNLVPRKRPDWIIDVCIRLLENNKNIELYVIGADYSDNNYYTKKFTDIISKNNLSEKIKLLGYQKNIPELIRNFDIFTLTSIKGGEAFPCVIIEAMASGLPIVSTDVAGVKEAVKNGVNGFLSDPDVFDDFYYNVHKLTENSKLRTLFGKESRNIYEKDFSLEKGIKKLKSYYLTVYQSDK